MTPHEITIVVHPPGVEPRACVHGPDEALRLLRVEVDGADVSPPLHPLAASVREHVRKLLEGRCSGS